MVIWWGWSFFGISQCGLSEATGMRSQSLRKISLLRWWSSTTWPRKIRGWWKFELSIIRTDVSTSQYKWICRDTWWFWPCFSSLFGVFTTQKGHSGQLLSLLSVYIQSASFSKFCCQFMRRLSLLLYKTICLQMDQKTRSSVFLIGSRSWQRSRATSSIANSMPIKIFSR